jgi:Helix-turn-helix domain
MSAEILTAEELAERWQVKVSYVYAKTRSGEIPKVPLPGRYYRYRLDVIEAFERGSWTRPTRRRKACWRGYGARCELSAREATHIGQHVADLGGASNVGGRGMIASDAAMHEAAHAVIAVALQRDFRSVSIGLRRDYARWIAGFRRADNDSPESRRQLAVIIDASIAAEVYRRRSRGEPLPSENEVGPSFRTAACSNGLKR